MNLNDSKFGRLQKFVASLELDAVGENEQALLLVGGFGGSGTRNSYGCKNSSDCRGTHNVEACENTGTC
jgi:hypothetical protein